MLLLLLLPAPGAQGAHPGPSIWGEMVMHEDHMVFMIEGAAGPLTTNLGLDVLLLGPLDEAVTLRLREEIAAFFAEHMPVLIDGQRSVPRLEDLIIQDGAREEASWRAARIVLHYPYAGWPRQMSISWHGFDGEGVDYIPITIKSAPEAAPRMFSLWPDEPQYIWHAESGPRRPRPAPVAPVRGERGGLLLPLPSALLVLGVALFFCFRRRLLPSRAAAVAVPVAGLALAGALWGSGRVTLPLPFTRSAALPAPEQARALFATLHQNVYQAFSAGSEDAIYDLLATSVDSGLLDELYGEIYESLVLREQGGAVCGIDEVEVVEGAVDPASYGAGAAAEFQIDWNWRVRGVVSHWGHVHRRTNHYRARYTVRHDGGSWKIAAVKVLEHERLENE